MKLKPHQRVDLETAKKRARDYLRKHSPYTVHASAVADEIWPGHNMQGQGAGAAASRILKRLEKDGKARWKSNGSDWGWTL